MRTKIIASLFICLFFNSSFSQTRTLLHTFERHVRVKSDPNLNGVMYFYGDKKEDYTIRLFSDSTFSITYFYSGTGNYYPNYKTFETIIGSFFNKTGVIYLIRNTPVFYSSLWSIDEIIFAKPIPRKLESIFIPGAPVKIEYADNGLTLYGSEEWSMFFMKKNSLKFSALI